MFRRLWRVSLFLILALTSGLMVQAPLAAQENPDCLGVDDYVLSVRTAQMAYQTTMLGMEVSSVEQWTPEELATAIQGTGTLIAGLEAITPPPAAVEIHSVLIESFTTWSQLLGALQESGLLGALSFLDAFNETGGLIDSTSVGFEETCQVAFVDNDNDGTPEIGAGVQPTQPTSAAIDPTQPLGSFQNPVPVGQVQDVGGGWEITVVAVRPDDTQAVLDRNSFNEPPIEGRQYFVADVMVENTGSEAASYDGNYRLRATGLNGDYTSFAPDDRCGVVDNEWDETVIQPGEQVTRAICWAIPFEEVNAIRLYDLEAVTEARVYFALATDDLTATPAAGR